MTTTSLHYDTSVILPHPRLPRVLLCQTGTGWTLPGWSTTDRHFWQATAAVNAGARALLGADVTTLRCLGTGYDEERARVARWYELELRDPHGLPTGGEWRGPESLPGVVDAGQRALLSAWFGEAAAGVPASRRAWARRGWIAGAEAWIDEQLPDLRLRRAGPVEQLRTWERGCVLRVPTTGGDIYFKALPAVFGHEIPLIEWLVTTHPAAVVRLLAVDHARHWMLMADMRGRSLDRVDEMRCWEEALRHFAALQIATAANAEALLSLGCPDCRVDDLADRIDPFFAVLPDYPGLSAGTIERLRALTPALKRHCARLPGAGIPAALEHGDFWPGNVVLSGGDYVFFDWSDCSLSHPFFSLTTFLALDEFPHVLATEPGTRERLRDAYLSPWHEFGDRASLVEAFEAAQQLGPLHLALFYHRTLLPAMEARWEMENMVAFYLRMLLR